MAGKKWMNHWKIWAGASLGLVILLIAYVWYASRAAIPTVQFVRATRTTLANSITSNGKIEPTDPHIIRSEIDTFVSGTFAKEGQPVRPNETIMTLDSNEIRARLSDARVQLLAAQDDLRSSRAGGPADAKEQLLGGLREAQLDVDRLRKRQETLEKLSEGHAATQDEMNQNAAALARAKSTLETLQNRKKEFADRAVTEEKSASMRAQEAEERVHVLENELQSATVISPINGTLYSFPLRQGDYIHVGDILAEIADLHKIQMRGFIDESDLGQLKLGQPVKITWDAMPDRTWNGMTEQIPRQVLTRGTRSVGEVLCSVENDKLELLPNVNVDVQILVQERKNVLVVPRGAVRTEQNKHYVYVLNDDRLHRNEVFVGISNSTSYEVVSGLNEGDLVAVSSNLDLREGSKVRPTVTQ